MMKIESERYAAQNGRQFQISEEEFRPFLILFFNKLPSKKSYWSVDEDLRNSLIRKAMTRARFLEILENIHFADNYKELPPKESEKYDRAWKRRPVFHHLGKHFQDMLQPETHQSIDEHMCKFKAKSIMGQYMKNKPIKWGFKFWFRCGAKSGYLYEFYICLRKKGNTKFGLGRSLILSLCQKLKDTHCFVFFDNFFTSPALFVKMLEMGIYAAGTMRANRKNMPVLKHDKEMKRGEHDWFSSNHLSAIKWMDNKSVIVLSNYFNTKETQQIERRVKGSKDKVKVTCPSVIQEYNQFMGGVNLSDQIKVTYEVHRRSKFRFYLRVFFVFLILPSSIQKSFTIKLNQHLHYLHSTFDTVLHKL